MHGQIPSLFTHDYHNIFSQVYPNTWKIKKKLKIFFLIYITTKKWKWLRR